MADRQQLLNPALTIGFVLAEIHATPAALEGLAVKGARLDEIAGFQAVHSCSSSQLRSRALLTMRC